MSPAPLTVKLPLRTTPRPYPQLIRIGMNSAARKAEVEVDGTLRVVYRRYWFLPVTWLLPSSIPIEGTVSLDVKSWNDKVCGTGEPL